ncbi:MAG: dihydroorotase [Solirubrobacteraceae bacterium]|nr:dihydroorotase [Solirubrobacteraceae bacterium]
MIVRAERPTTDLFIRDVYAVDVRAGLDGPVDVLVTNGEITRIAPAGQLDIEELDGLTLVNGEGLHLFPGFFDPHVHLRIPGQGYKETIATGTASAAAGGFTGIVAMPNTNPVIDSTAVLAGALETARKEAVIGVGFTACITKGMSGSELSEMAALKDLGAVAFTDDGKPVADAQVFRMACRYQRLTDMVLMLHEEEPSLSGGGAMNEGAVSAALGISGQPNIAESTLIARDAAIAGYEGARVHVQHLSARESLDAVRTARSQGIQITCEASPHHLLLTDEACRTLDTHTKMNPPLRTETDRQALIAAVLDGTIDCIATDHAPHSRDEKALPFEQAPFGVTGLETSFAACYTELVLKHGLELSRLVELMAAGAALVGLEPPVLAEGRPADLCLVDLQRTWTVGEGGYVSKSANCAFDGMELQSKVVLTVSHGSIAHADPSLSLDSTSDPEPTNA